jgi:oxygen-independent coproporphyrinogen-3 oxidase
LSHAFDLRHAEVTLEGVPIYFLKRQPPLWDILREELPARHFRLSMGIQTFDEDQLERMGRTAFGTGDTFREVVRQAHDRGFTVSGDLLFDLPHQTLSQMEQDVRRAVEIGLDHVGLYHLVMFRGLGTAWSRDDSLLAGLPANETAADNWLALRQLLLDSGFYQTTLTNFEWLGFKEKPSRFLYEECSFQPSRFEMLGFGPSAISFSADARFQHGSKVLNPDSYQEYVAAVERGGPVWNRYFEFVYQDLRIFFLTRRLAALTIDPQEYRSIFGVDMRFEWSEELAALEEEELLEVTSRVIQPTPRGMFYADSIASLLAGRRFGRFDSNGHGHM